MSSIPAAITSRLINLEQALTDCMLSDRIRLGRRLQRLRTSLEIGRPPRRLDRDLDHLASRAAASQKALVARQRALTTARIDFPAELPISACVEQIRTAIQEHPVVIVAGDTGSGKTTQIPKICLQAGRGREAKIAVTQPRRVAATSLSRRLAEELGVEWGRQVGAKIRFDDKTSPETLVKFVTDGMLLAEIRSDRDLLEYDTLIVDEAHERSLNIDFLLGYLRTLQARRPDLKIIVTSATIDTESFSQAFDGAPVIEVSGRVFPVETRYWPLEELLEDSDGDFSYTEGAATACARLLDESNRGDVLVFMPSERDIRETGDLLSARLSGHRGVEVLPMFSRLTASEQHKVFGAHSGRRIVIATNIAETSLTIPGIRYVVDTGLARISRYNPRNQTQRLPIEAISQSSAEQRKGRCGRVQEGVCVRLYSAEDYGARDEYTQPEIQRANLAEVILRMLDLEFGDVETFPFIDPPKPQAIRGGYQLLEELGAIDRGKSLTRLGQDMAHMPISPTVSRMVLQAHAEGALPEILVIAAGVSAQDPRERPAGQESEADRMHQQFVDNRSDFLTLFNIWIAYHDRMEQGTQSQLRKFCRQHFLSFLRMREWRDIHAQLRNTLEELGGFRLDLSCAQRDDAYDAVHRCVLTGLFSNVAHKKESADQAQASRNHYSAAHGRQVMLFPGSGLFERRAKSSHSDERASAPAWIVAAEMVETNRLYARTAAVIKPEWIVDLGQYLCRSSYRDPHWSRAAGRVLVHETQRLHGLVVAQRRVGYGKIAPREARDIFIREALIAAEVDGISHAFYEHNRQTFHRLETWQSRLRQRHAIDLADAFHDFYAEHLPEGTASTHDLNGLIRDHGGDDGFLHANEATLLSGSDLSVDRDAFPDAVELDGQQLELAYAYTPGQEQDGVTLKVPYRLIDAVRPEVLDWLVPGLRQERITHLLRSLPKALRKRFVPVPETARKIAAELTPAHGDGTFLDALENFIEDRWRVQVRRADWDPTSVPDHLRMRLEIEGSDGRTVAAGRDLAQLAGKLDRPAESPLQLDAWKAAAALWEQDDVISWSFVDLPERVEVTQLSGVPVFGFPGLLLEDHRVYVRLFDDRSAARAASVAGFRRLCELALRDETAWLQRELKDLRPIVDRHRSLGEPTAIEAQAYEHLARYLFLEGGVLPLTRQRFDERVDRARQRVRGLCPRFLGLIGEIMAIRSQLVATPRPYPGLEEDVERLLPPGFLDDIEFDQLSHLIRYLKAVVVRADRFRADAARDASKAALIAPFAADCQRLRGATDVISATRRQRTEELRWMVEEYRVSVFAQELGTAQRVSAKRLERQLEAVEKADGGV
ncbi:MAG: ATP-dependent RNA helicase HrpA [Candidatus Latescibacterota bacterium]